MSYLPQHNGLKVVSMPYLEENQALTADGFLFVKDALWFCYSLIVIELLQSLRDYFDKALTDFETKWSKQ